MRHESGNGAAFVALERVLKRGSLRRNVLLVGQADEEFGSQGIRDVLDELAPAHPDWLLATEPTGLHAITRHKGSSTPACGLMDRRVTHRDPQPDATRSRRWRAPPW